MQCSGHISVCTWYDISPHVGVVVFNRHGDIECFWYNFGDATYQETISEINRVYIDDGYVRIDNHYAGDALKTLMVGNEFHLVLPQ